MIDESGHCLTTCQLHDSTHSRLDRHDNVLYGEDSDGGLIAKTNRIIDTLDTIKKLVYALVGMSLGGIIYVLGRLIVSHGGA
jgi:hypothetical protein